ncbi:MAG: hypothetical protein ACREAA_21145 [Candidatus Polarisedimenticolia bacterium]
MADRRCSAHKKDKTQCEQHPIKDSKYCYVHSIGRFRGVPIFRNPSFQGILGVLGLVAGAAFFYWGPSASQQQAIADNVSAIKGQMQRVEVRYEDELKRHFQLGYILFTVDDRRVVIPNISTLPARFEVSWDKTTVHLAKDSLSVAFERIAQPAHELEFNNVGFAMKRQVGFNSGNVGIGNVSIGTALLEDHGSYVICAVGFSEE